MSGVTNVPMVGDPDVVLAGATALAATAEPFTSSAEGVRAAGNEMSAGWSGAAAASAGEVLSRVGTSGTLPAEVVTAARPILEAYAQALREAQRTFALGEQMVEQGAQTQLAEATQPSTRSNDQVIGQAAARVAEGEALQAQAVAAEAQANRAATAGIEGLTAQLAAMSIPTVGGGPAAGSRTVVGQGHAPLPGFDAPPASTTPVEEDEGWSFSDIGHTVLDVGGLVPVLGEPLDLVNAAWYGAEGDYVSAALSAGAAVPVAGWVFTGGKFLNKGVKLVDGAADARVWLRNRPPMVPADARRLPFGANPKFSVGEKFVWKDGSGTTVRYHAHGPDPDLPPSTNAGAGPVYRKRIGSQYVDADGRTYSQNVANNTNSPAFDEAAANATHIPYPAGLRPPGAARVAVANPTSLVDGLGDGGETR